MKKFMVIMLALLGDTATYTMHHSATIPETIALSIDLWRDSIHAKNLDILAKSCDTILQKICSWQEIDCSDWALLIDFIYNLSIQPPSLMHPDLTALQLDFQLLGWKMRDLKLLNFSAPALKFFLRPITHILKCLVIVHKCISDQALRHKHMPPEPLLEAHLIQIRALNYQHTLQISIKKILQLQQSLKDFLDQLFISARCDALAQLQSGSFGPNPLLSRAEPPNNKRWLSFFNYLTGTQCKTSSFAEQLYEETIPSLLEHAKRGHAVEFFCKGWQKGPDAKIINLHAEALYRLGRTRLEELADFPPICWKNIVQFLKSFNTISDISTLPHLYFALKQQFCKGCRVAYDFNEITSIPFLEETFLTPLLKTLHGLKFIEKFLHEKIYGTGMVVDRPLIALLGEVESLNYTIAIALSIKCTEKLLVDLQEAKNALLTQANPFPASLSTLSYEPSDTFLSYVVAQFASSQDFSPHPQAAHGHTGQLVLADFMYEAESEGETDDDS